VAGGGVAVLLPAFAVDAKANFAVLVGVNDYHYSGDLDWAVSDANDMEAELNYQPEQMEWTITELLDQAASSSSIESAINAMKNSASSGDICLFYFSGHGGANAIIACDWYSNPDISIQ